jgi:MoaA/NifB/PqqE/SkfB family radical SAM enzyme
MYNLQDIRVIHLEVTSKCQASCPMCVRNIRGGVDSPDLKISEITLDQFKKWFSVDFIKQLDKVYMCGNTGDPILAKDTLSIFEYLRTVNTELELSMNTNGSARDIKFWQGLAELKVAVRFGIDGMNDTHSLYRIGTDWNKVIHNVQTFINNGGYAVWDMLIFDHNKHQVDACEQLSRNLGFAQFVTKNTSRFQNDNLTVLNKDGTISHILKPSIKSKQITEKLSEQESVITCKVKTPGSLYVSAEGKIAPCCWLDFNAISSNAPSHADFISKGFNNPNLHIQDLKQIFDNNFFTRIEQSWTKNPLRACSRQCGKVDKFNEQFK